MNKTRRGTGCIYLRGKIWWIKFFKNGRPFHQSSQSQHRKDAVNLLQLRQGEIALGRFAGFGPDRVLMAVTVKPDTTFTTGAPQALFKMPVADRGDQTLAQVRYQPTRDGHRFLITADIEEPASRPVTVILHWPALVRR